MNWKLLQILGILSLIFPIQSQTAIEVELDDLDLDDLEEDEEILRQIEAKHIADINAHENDVASRNAAEWYARANNLSSPTLHYDPCAKTLCSAGKICVSSGIDAKCVCIPECPVENDPRRRVCTNRNETWPSDCEVYKQKCLCDTGEIDCRGEEYSHIHIDYYGECKELPECSEDEMNDFPRRMRDWLFNIMRDLAERNELSQHYMDMEMEAESNYTRRWINAAIWKWCDLDGDSSRSISRHELFPIRAPLVSLEHCIAPFLETCDPNGDHIISLREWGQCLKLEENDIADRCEDIRIGENFQKD